MASIAIFVIVWTVLQFVLRIAHVVERGPKSQVAHTLFAGLVQDLGVALVAFGIARVFMAEGADLRNIVAGIFLWTFVVVLYIDHRIHTRLGSRIHSAIASLDGIRNLLSSALELGLIRLAGEVLVLSLLVGLSVPQLVGQGTASSVHPAVSIACGISVALFGYWCTPSTRRYSTDNLVLSLTRHFLTPAMSQGHIGPQDRDAPDQGAVFDNGWPLFRSVDVRSPLRVAVRRDGMPHVLIVFMESFRSADIGVLGSPAGATPGFDQWSERGILFSNFYANGIQTIRALAATLYGLLPRLSPRPTERLQSTLHLRGLPHIFNEFGYRTSFWHGGDSSFQNQGRFLDACGFTDIKGRESLKASYPQAQATTSWGIDDEYVFKLAAEDFIRSDADGLPTFGAILTVSHHHPWHVPKGHAAPVFDANNDVHQRFLQTMNYSDACLGAFLDELWTRGILERTIVVVVGDHGQPMGERDGNFQLWGQIYEQSLRVPLLILAPTRVPEGRVDHTISSQVDVLPTILDLLGVDTRHHAFGSSLLRQSPERTAYFGNPFTGGFMGLRKGVYKLIVGPTRAESMLFDLSIDPAEQRNRRHVHEATALELEHDCRQAFLWNEMLYATNAFAPHPGARPVGRGCIMAPVKQDAGLT